MTRNKPFGTWPSPITAESLSTSITASDTCIDEANQMVYWCEIVPEEDGRGQIMTVPLLQPSTPAPLLPVGYSCRSRVHEYGGGSLAVHDGLLVFSNDTDFCLYAMDLDSKTLRKVTAESNKLYRYGDIVIDPQHRFVVCIREEHFENETPQDVVNTLVSVCLETGKVQTIASGADFYAYPRLHDDRIAFISWVHSNMPWNATQLHAGQLDVQQPPAMAQSSIVVGDTMEESIVQPEFGLDGQLYFASDRSGFWNLYRIALPSREIVSLLPEPLEQEFAGPLWFLGTSWYKPSRTDATKLVCLDHTRLAVIDTQARTLTVLKTLYTHMTNIRLARASNGGDRDVVVANASSSIEPTVLIAYDVGRQTLSTVLRPSTTPQIDASYITIGEEIAFPTTNDKVAYCYFYRPKHPEYTSDGLPPLIVLSHGGPTTDTNSSYSLSIQYWTTRGFAVADVNYGGSTGYGREYRNRLDKQWGIVDVDDCCNAALHLARQGLVDGDKLAIEGGSAGGFTTLASMTFRNVFKAGCCRYGISDITLLAKETHKFESRYPDRLIGEYPQEKAVYEERSPLFRADDITSPIIFFQGSEDKVVPPSQSEIMVDAMKKKGVPVAYVLYEGEAHGFRRAANIKRTMELTQWFYGQIFGFTVEGVEGTEIFNFDAWRNKQQSKA